MPSTLIYVRAILSFFTFQTSSRASLDLTVVHGIRWLYKRRRSARVSHGFSCDGALAFRGGDSADSSLRSVSAEFQTSYISTTVFRG